VSGGRCWATEESEKGEKEKERKKIKNDTKRWNLKYVPIFN
jgi:hypothetical protein